MLQPPGDVHEQALAALLTSAYGVSADEIAFLPLGADVDTAVYRVLGSDGTPYFLKLRRGAFSPLSVALPSILAEQGHEWLIPPIPTLNGSSWSRHSPFTAVLYPFVGGLSGWDVALTDEQWKVFGAALRALHDFALPPTLESLPAGEDFSSRWRRRVTGCLDSIGTLPLHDPVAVELVRLLREHHRTIRHIVQRAEELANELASQRLDLRLCHGDIHAGNVLIDTSGRLRIVDWDTLVLAPKERDLMFVGGGVGGRWNQERELDSFYAGYGRGRGQGDGAALVNKAALTYYRYERIVQDVAEFCAQLLESDQGGEDRRAALAHFAAQFEPGNVVEIAIATDEEL